MKKKIKRKLLNINCSIVSSLRNFDPEENLLIFSEPRGGSTWLAETISRLPNTPILWEPLHLKGIDHFKKYGFGWGQIIPEDANWKEAETAFRDMLTGKVLNDWLCIASPPFDFLFAKRMLVKFCRANAMLPWLTKVFNFKYAPLYLVRHPIAVVASQLKHGAWNHLPENFQIPSNRYNDIYLQNHDFLSNLTSKAEALLANWCIMNINTMNNNRNNKDWITVYYEDLITDPAKEMHRIFSTWHLDMPPTILNKISKASKTTKEATFQHSIKDQLEKWKYFFDKSQLEKFDEIFEYFGLNYYDTKNVTRINE